MTEENPTLESKENKIKSKAFDYSVDTSNKK